MGAFLLMFYVFQPTPSSRRETCPLRQTAAPAGYFNPLPPRGGRPIWRGTSAARLSFQPTPSSRRETSTTGRTSTTRPISTHSLLAEGDAAADTRQLTKYYFNPLPPRGGRRSRRHQTVNQVLFQPTPSSRRETGSTEAIVRSPSYFNPLPPRGGRPRRVRARLSSHVFQPTPSSRRETRPSTATAFCRTYFNPLPPRGGRRDGRAGGRKSGEISTHSLLAEGDAAKAAVEELIEISTHSRLAEGDPGGAVCVKRQT